MTIRLSEVTQRFQEEPYAIARGPSVLGSIANGELELNADARFAVPDVLLKLLERVLDGDLQARNVLSSVFGYFDVKFGKSGRSKGDVFWHMARRLASVIKQLTDAGNLEVLSSSTIDVKLNLVLADLYEQPRFKIELSPRASFLKAYVLRVYSWATEQGHVVLEKGRRIFSDLRSRISTLELAARADAMVEFKANYFERRLNFRGSRATKFFLAVSIGVTGLVLPAAGLAGLLIAFVDP